MKFSKKGFLKLFCKKGECLADVKEREFEPDDFQGCVILTVMEAKDILHSLNCAWSRCPVKAECKDLIKKKIKQVENE